jgi:hypothetical protein
LPTPSATTAALPEAPTQATADAGTGCTPDLLKFLAAVADPRDPRGIRHPLIAVLAIAACAVAAGEKTFAEIAEWGRPPARMSWQRSEHESAGAAAAVNPRAWTRSAGS